MSTTYLKGCIIGSGATGITNFAWQKTSWNLKADKASIATAKGNVQKVEFYNHIAEVKVNASFAKEDVLPIHGSAILLTGIKIPAITEAGVATGDFQITGVLSDTAKFQVEDISGESQSKEFQTCDLALVRYIEMGIPA